MNIKLKAFLITFNCAMKDEALTEIRAKEFLFGEGE